MTEKMCSRCKQELPLSSFSKASGYADGHSGWCKPCHVQYSQAHHAANMDSRIESARRWDRNNLERRQEIRRNWARRNRPNRTPIQKLHAAISSELWRQLKARKDGRCTEQLLGYAIADLKIHLELQFKEGMSWANYGKWHVDHIRPKVSFAITSAGDEALRECWAISNLQPLWALENLKKGRTVN